MGVNMRFVIKEILSILYKSITVRKASILIIENAYPSGSSTKRIYDYLKGEYQVDWIRSDEILFKRKNTSDYLNYIRQMLKVSRYHIIITSHGFRKLKPEQVLIDLWHGIPLKAMGFMENDERIYDPEPFNTDYLITNSKLDSMLMAACTHIPFSKHHILGSPRTDYLLNPGKNKIKELEKYDKVIIYMPTFRQGYRKRTEGKISDGLFPFDDFEENEWIQYLQDHNYLLIVKLHPLEEKYVIKKMAGHPNIWVLSTETLLDLDMDLYELLPHTDLLITDYSSVYIDYLLLDQPMIFLQHDLQEYRQTRGLLLEPYDFWTPGYKVKTQSELIHAVEKSFDRDEYAERRQNLKAVFHVHKDGKATGRTVELIDRIIAGHVKP